MVTCPAYFGDRSFQDMKVPQLPLTRLTDSAFDAQLEGVISAPPCVAFVSHEALTDKAQGSGQAEALTSSTNIEGRSRTLQAPNTTLGRSPAMALSSSRVVPELLRR